MFTGLLQWIAGRPASGPYERAFVREVRVQGARAIDPRLRRFVLICWLLIAVKQGAVVWAVHHYQMPIHPSIVNLPTWLFGLTATAALYIRRD